MSHIRNALRSMMFFLAVGVVVAAVPTLAGFTIASLAHDNWRELLPGAGVVVLAGCMIVVGGMLRIRSS